MTQPAPSTLPSAAVAVPATDWTAIAWSGAAIALVVGAFWAALHFAGRPRRLNPVSTRVQSLLFSRRLGWTVEKANRWADSHGYKAGDADVTAGNIRLRQRDPGQFRRLRTMTFSDKKGIKAVVGR